jgi:hypothetical protein
MRGIAAVLGLAGALALGVSSSASAAGDPLHVRVCGDIVGFCAPLADVSVQGLLGPGVGALCSPRSELRIPFTTGIAGLYYGDVVICEQ